MSKKKSSNKAFIQKAFYPGGREALKAFISANLKYPQEAINHQVEGTVHAEYQVNHRGKVIKVKALTKLGHGLEEEAIRLTKLLKFSVPQKVRNIRITFNKTIWINFKLPKTEPIVESEEKDIDKSVTNQTVQYTIVKTPKEEKKEEIKKEEIKEEKITNKITYTINI